MSLMAIFISVKAHADHTAVHSTEERLKPVGEVVISGESQAPAAATQVVSVTDQYQTACAVCHAAGVAGAPKFGDKAAWAPRLTKGMKTLVKNAINGLNAMPPKGMCPSCSDEEISSLVEYMVNAVK